MVHFTIYFLEPSNESDLKRQYADSCPGVIEQMFSPGGKGQASTEAVRANFKHSLTQNQIQNFC